MSLSNEHTSKIEKILFSEYVRLKFYDGNNWRGGQQLVILGDRLGYEIYFPKTKVRFLDPVFNPVVFSRQFFRRFILPIHPVFEVTLQSTWKSIQTDTIRAMLDSFPSYKSPPFLSVKADDTMLLSFWSEGDAVLAVALLNEYLR